MESLISEISSQASEGAGEGGAHGLGRSLPSTYQWSYGLNPEGNLNSSNITCLLNLPLHHFEQRSINHTWRNSWTVIFLPKQFFPKKVVPYNEPVSFKIFPSWRKGLGEVQLWFWFSRWNVHSTFYWNTGRKTHAGIKGLHLCAEKNSFPKSVRSKHNEFSPSTF